MGAYRTYEWERKTYPQFRTIPVLPLAQAKYLNKLARHFKVPSPALDHRARGRAGFYTRKWFGGEVNLHKLSNLGTLCHEFAHHLAHERWGGCQHHNKKFKRELKRVYTFAKRYLPSSIRPATLRQKPMAECNAINPSQDTNHLITPPSPKALEAP